VTTKLKARSNDPDIGWIHFSKNYGERHTTSWMAGGNFSVRRGVYLEVGGMDENYIDAAPFVQKRILRCVFCKPAIVFSSTLLHRLSTSASGLFRKGAAEAGETRLNSIITSTIGISI
jgi:hypothetical protein